MNPLLPKFIIPWYAQNKRDLPWRKNREPYKVWLSEIMLQQTRVQTVIPYYGRFLAELPTIGALAAVGEEQLNKLWEGLGYYSRARNLQKAARVIVNEYGGIFPTEYEKILKLPGVGAYTAGAIASICFDAPVPAVDGNVLRVIARAEECRGDISAPATKKKITESLAAVYPKTNCGDFTQGLIELGATVCLPNGKPNCENCPIQSVCKAFQNGTVNEIPVKSRAVERKREKITVLVLMCDNCFAIRKRAEKGLLAGLWEFPNQSGKLLTPKQAEALAADWGAMPKKIERASGKTHIFTHIEWDMRFYFISCEARPEQFLWVTAEDLKNVYAVPSAFHYSREL